MRANAVEKNAVSDTMRKSQAAASAVAAPTQAPRTMAIVGLGMPCSSSGPSLARRVRSAELSMSFQMGSSFHFTHCGSLRSIASNSLMSPPAQKALPAPVRTTTRTSGAAADSRRRSLSSRVIEIVRPFIEAGRLSVTVRMPSSRVVRMSVPIGFSVGQSKCQC